MKHILDSSKEKVCLIFINEILRGTNEKERVAISKAVLQQLFAICLLEVYQYDLEILSKLKES